MHSVWTLQRVLRYNTPAMRLPEFRAKEILFRYGIPVPRGAVVETPARAAAEAELIGSRVALKAQVAAGGRGKAGGILFALGPEDARAKADTLFKTRLVTPQTGPNGLPIRRILVEEAASLRSEFYVGAAVDRPRSRIVLVVSSHGGIEIEETARTKLKTVFREEIDPVAGLRPFQARRLSFALGLSGDAQIQGAAILSGVVRAFLGNDATMVEINPLGLTDEGLLLALDAKIDLDDNALYRHPDFRPVADDPDADPAETAAERTGLHYVRLGGDIGCLVNGAGLAMATADLIRAAGGRPADFLDIGGGVSEDAVRKGFKIILSDPEIRAVLVNIFGGIVRCDLVARGLIGAAQETAARIPFIVRFQGTNAEEARDALAASGIAFTTAESMGEAAEKAIAAARRGSGT
ncbi:MAG: ADP-forming succinate--CoA ligase subunit beta [Candidatus Aminicenantales bacterium]